MPGLRFLGGYMDSGAADRDLGGSLGLTAAGSRTDRKVLSDGAWPAATIVDLHRARLEAGAQRRIERARLRVDGMEQLFRAQRDRVLRLQEAGHDATLAQSCLELMAEAWLQSLRHLLLMQQILEAAKGEDVETDAALREATCQISYSMHAGRRTL